jgi:hypothetical protein
MATGSRPYGFRFPFDIRTAMEPWRGKIGDEFDHVIASLTDRDRAIEDYLSLGVAQGYLGVGPVPNTGQSLTAAYADITGASVAFTVPSGRELLVTAYCDIINLDAVARSSFIQILDENNVVLLGTSRSNVASGSGGASQPFRETVFTQPSRGTHTYRLQALINGGSGTLTSNVPANASGGTSFLSVEDVGPATRF